MFFVKQLRIYSLNVAHFTPITMAENILLMKWHHDFLNKSQILKQKTQTHEVHFVTEVKVGNISSFLQCYTYYHKHRDFRTWNKCLRVMPEIYFELYWFWENGNVNCTPTAIFVHAALNITIKIFSKLGDNPIVHRYLLLKWHFNVDIETIIIKVRNFNQILTIFFTTWENLFVLTNLLVH